jgi:tRNA-specific 2-thiouridylase
MSGGVDSSATAALLKAEGYDVVGVTLQLYDHGAATHRKGACCAGQDIYDARLVAERIGIPHYVLDYEDRFREAVIDRFADSYAAGETPVPCIECNRSIKFARLLERARALGFDALATGHHAAVVTDTGGTLRVGRGADAQKDQSYVLHMLDQSQLASTMFPVGSITKAEVRRRAAALGLRTAQKAESQEVCFIAGGSTGRRTFLGDRIGLTPARVVDTAGTELGQVPARELVTLGQRRGLAIGGTGDPRYVVDIDAEASTITVGRPEDLLVDATPLGPVTWSDGALSDGARVLVQTSAHGAPAPAVFSHGSVVWDAPRPRVAPGQSVVLYDLGNQFVLGGAPAT